MKDKDLWGIASPFSGMVDVIQSEIVQSVGVGKSLSLPTVASLLNSHKGLRDLVQEKFDSVGTKSGKYGDVAYDIQLLQGVLFTSLVFGYHKPSGKVALYTACEKVITAISPEYNFNIGKTYDLNVEGVLNAARVDIDYTSKETFSAKLTRLTVKTNLVSDEYILVPLESVSALAGIIKDQLSKGRVAYTQQLVSGLVKERFISMNATVLRKYTDSPEFASDVSSKSVIQLARHKAYFPIVGATSNTIGMTAIDLLLLEKLGFVKDNGSLVEVSDFGGIIRLVVTSLLSNELARNYSEELQSKYNEYVSGIVDIITQAKFLEVVNDIVTPEGMPSDAIVSLEATNLILRDMTDDQLQQTWLMFKEKGMQSGNPQDLVKLINTSYEQLPIDISKEELRGLLDSSVLKVVTTKKNGSFSTMYVTNSEDILSQVYGADYRKALESKGVLIREAKKYLEQGELTFDEVMEYLGFDSFVGRGPKLPKDNLATFEELVATESDYKPRKSNSNENLVLGRRLFGVVTPKGVEDYYCNIDTTRIYQVVKLS
jgi:hypothetical protein